jgi:hypothetical protein
VYRIKKLKKRARSKGLGAIEKKVDMFQFGWLNSQAIYLIKIYTFV